MATQVRGSYFYKQSQVTVKYLLNLMGAKLFDYQKDHVEIKRLIRYVTASDDNAVIVDFFAGSGSTAGAVMELNREDGTSKRFVLIQLPEPCDPKEKSDAALNKGLNTIADIAKERIRRAAAKFDRSGQQREWPGSRLPRLQARQIQLPPVAEARSRRYGRPDRGAARAPRRTRRPFGLPGGPPSSRSSSRRGSARRRRPSSSKSPDCRSIRSPAGLC